MRLLLVEDDEDIAGSLLRGLGEQGHAVDHAADGLTALDYAETSEFDLIILDVMLPGLDGISVCRTLRDRRIKTPILMLTARDSIDDRVAGLDSGADDYLVKPFAFAELLARVRALSRRESEVADPVLRIADLELDTASRQAKRDGSAIELTAKEYALLEYFMRNPGRVLTREMITERLWSYDAGGMTNVVDVYIRRLRRKIDDDSEIKLIQTLRGAGYKVEA